MKKIVLAVVLLAIVIGGYLVYDRAFAPTLPPSGPMTTSPLETPAVSATEQPQQAATPVAMPTDAATSQATAAVTAAGGVRRFQIGQDGSSAQFMIYEELRGTPTNVVGVTKLVSGEIAVDPSDLSTARVGPIQVNARDLTTDQEMRNRVMRNTILSTNEYEFITFTPTQISGLSGSAAPDVDHPIQIAGDLQIRDVTKPVTFGGTVKLTTDGAVAGRAVAKVNRGDFNLVVPNLAFLANVGEQVTLQIDFRATPVAQ
jgi:polyisoprenoid-binding protein YceI